MTQVKDPDPPRRGLLAPHPARPVHFLGVRRAIRWMRWGLMAFTLFFAAYILTTYGLYTVPGDYRAGEIGPVSPDVEKGDTLVLQNFNFGRSPRIGDIVIYRRPGAGREDPADLIGRVAGVGGEKLERVGPTMKIGGREPLSVGFDIGAGAPLKDGDVIPEGHCLIVVNTDPDYYPDSRKFGFVPNESITRRVAMNMATFVGRKQHVR